jgi:hypothetical protein
MTFLQNIYVKEKIAAWTHAKTYRMVKMGCTDLESDIFILPPFAVNLIA